MTVRDMVLQVGNSTNEATIGLLEQQLRGLLGDSPANYFRQVLVKDGYGNFLLDDPKATWNIICELAKV